MTSLMDALALGAIYALIAVGYTLVYGIIKLINFAHGEFFMGAAFAGYFVLRGVSTGHPVLDFLVAILAGAGVAAVLALAAERIAYRPLRKESLAGRRAVEVLAPLLVALVILGYTPRQYAWIGIAVAIAAGIALSATAGHAIERISWRSLNAAGFASAFLVGGLAFLCAALLPLRARLWALWGWAGEDAGTGAPVGSVLIAALLIGAFLGGITYLAAGKHLGRATRIAGLLTALGVSLFLQALATRFWAAPRECRDPFERKHVALEQLQLGPTPDPVYYTKGGIIGGTEELLFAVDDEVTREALRDASSAGIRYVYSERPPPRLHKQILVLLVAALATVALTAVVKSTRYGRAIRALSQDADAARLVGVNPDRVIAFTFFLGAILAGLAGVLVGTYYGSVSPMMGYGYGIKAFIAAVVGGIGSVPGACLGGLVLGIAERLFAGLFTQGAAKDVAAFGLLILILFVRPSGILGKKDVNRA